MTCCNPAHYPNREALITADRCAHPHSLGRSRCWACEIAQRRPTTEQRIELFIGKVSIRDGCWNWNAHVDRDGYGTFKSESGQTRAHRWSYETFFGPIPDGMQVDHFVCDNTSCVRPDHLRLATVRENVLRAPYGISAINGRKTHCKHGHPFDALNTRRTKSGRECRACRDKPRIRVLS